MKQNALFASPLVPVLFLVLLGTDVAVMIFEKMGASVAGTAVGNELGFYLRLIQLPWTWMVIVLSPIQLLTWSKILSKTELSIAYPVSSLCFPLTMITSAIVFHEHVSSLAWIGGMILTAGIAIVGSEKEHKNENASQQDATEAERVPALATSKSKDNSAN